MRNFEYFLIFTYLFKGLDGKLGQKNTLTINQKNIICISAMGPYLVVLFDSLIQVK